MIDVCRIKLATLLDFFKSFGIMSIVMKNYTFTIRRHYEFQIEAENYDDAVEQLNATISDGGLDDNSCIFEDCDYAEEVDLRDTKEGD